MESVGFFGIVQPQDERTCVMNNAADPVLVNLNERMPSSPLLMVP